MEENGKMDEENGEIESLEDSENLEFYHPNSLPDFLHKINHYFHSLFSSPPPENLHFQAIPDPNAIVFLFVEKHGGYLINDQMEYNIITCPVTNLIRLKVAPNGSCSWGHNADTAKHYKMLYESFDNINVANECNILTILQGIAENNKMEPAVNEDLFKLSNTKIGAFEKKICQNVHKSNEIILTHTGGQLLDKCYSLDPDIHTPSGFTIFYKVTFRLPDVFQNSNTNHFIQRIESERIQQKFNYAIGKATVKNGIYYITYENNTELLSCPYFHTYLRLIGCAFELENAASITQITIGRDSEGMYEDPQYTFDTCPFCTIRPMVKYVYSEQILDYFKYVGTVVYLDYSCGAILMPAELKQRLKKKGMTTAKKIFNKKLIDFVKISNIKGGQGYKKRKQTKHKRNI